MGGMKKNESKSNLQSQTKESCFSNKSSKFEILVWGNNHSEVVCNLKTAKRQTDVIAPSAFATKIDQVSG